MAKNEMKYLEALRQMDQVIIKTDPNGAITFWNTRAESTFGFSAGEVTGKNIVAVTCDTGSRSANDMAVSFTTPAPVMRTPLCRSSRTGRRTAGTSGLPGTPFPAGTWLEQWPASYGSDRISVMVTRQDPPPPGTGPWKQQLLEGTDVAEEVFDILFHTAIQLGRGGRESRKIGTSFLVGDAERVMAHSRQCSINAFEGKEQKQRMLQDRGNVENIKNLALLDGAFVIGGSGFIHASSRHLLADLFRYRNPARVRHPPCIRGSNDENDPFDRDRRL